MENSRLKPVTTSPSGTKTSRAVAELAGRRSLSISLLLNATPFASRSSQRTVEFCRLLSEPAPWVTRIKAADCWFPFNPDTESNMQPLPSWVQLVALALCVCQICALPNQLGSDEIDYAELDRNEGPFTPQPLRPPPWQEAQAATPQEARVQVPGVGDIVGVRGYKTISNRPINAFLGVHYAQVGAGLGRFQQAKAVPFQGRVDATTASPNCAQFPELQRLQTAEARGENVDDCLTLDIYAPEGARDLPVLVFVHGEMLFDGGAEEAQPDYVLEKDIILVSINYRLAPFGFLSALSDQLPGNVALSDIHLALEWLQRNLLYFGGDSGKVTLVGQAGGATLVHALSLSGRATNLFQQLILQSGTALNPYLIDERPLETLATFARLARCPYAGRSLAPLYDCLSRLPTSQVVSAFEQLLQQNEASGLSFLGGFKLVVGDPLGYLPDHPAALAANSANSSVPMIVGAAKDASAFILSRFYDQIQRVQSQNVSEYINVVLRHTAPPSQHRVWLDWARREIFSPEHDRTASAQSVSQGLLELSNMILYRAPVIYSIRLSHKKSPVYLYTFDYRGEHHRFGHLDNPLPFGVDASLSDDSVYLFPYPPEASRLNPVDKSLSRALVTMWVNFAVTGIPNQNAGVWPKATSEYGPFLRFTNSRQSMLELDPHFGDGLNAPNLYGQYFNTTNSTAAITTTVTTTTTTTTTTTRRPYVYNPYAGQQQNPYPYGYNTTTRTSTTTTRRPTYAYNPYANWQPNRQPQPAQPFPRRPTDPAYERVQEIRRQQVIREQQEREQRQREQREREQQEAQRREEEEREQQRVQEQREQEAQRELEQRYQLQREKLQREQQQREQLEREQKEDQEQQQREREQREQAARDEWERNQERAQVPQTPQEELEQRQREWEWEQEQREREQREREQREREQPNHPEEQDERELDEREQQEREEQQRQEILQEQRRQYDQRQREQQQREQEQREREQPNLPEEQDERELDEREQQEREEQQRQEILQEQRRQYDQRQREQQQREQEQREQQAREQQEQQEQQQREQEQREQEKRDQQEREQQQREELERGQQPHEPNEPEDDQESSRRPYANYDDYLGRDEEGEPVDSEPENEQSSNPTYSEEQEREQQQREQLHREQQDNVAQNPPEGEDPAAYASFDDYLRAEQERREAEEREWAEQADRTEPEGWEDSRPEYPGYRQHAKQLRRQQRPKL
ncbi:glutactin [Drosophila obscura]|uniref:glutactin n=1 Tax=Drosophila obscura TaxID=7282 RepID=UPI001BB220BA|nr:glutactin [Drosophila obscura]